MIRGKQRLGKIDVFCGRGKGFDEFPGYQFFRNLIHGYSTSYSSARTSRAERSQLIRTILTQLKTRTIRFIKRSDVNNWVVLEEKEINIKIGHALRDVEAVLRKQERNKRKKLNKKMAWARQGRTCKQIQPATSCGYIHVSGEIINPNHASTKLASQESTSSVDLSDEMLTPEQDESKSMISPIKLPESFDFSDLDPIKFDDGGIPDPSSPPFSLVDISLLLLACEAPLLGPIFSSGSISNITSDDWICDKSITQV